MALQQSSTAAALPHLAIARGTYPLVQLGNHISTLLANLQDIVLRLASPT
jgi:hypothetical protein